MLIVVVGVAWVVGGAAIAVLIGRGIRIADENLADY